MTKGRLQCWDNSTRGLDSFNALKFARTLRNLATEIGTTTIVTVYQVSEDIYNVRIPGCIRDFHLSD